jgi:flavodoxin
MLATKHLERRDLMRRLLFALPIAAATVRGRGESTVASRQASPSPQAGSATPGMAGSNVLLAWFSRAGENYYHGDRIDLEVGNTAVVAGMIGERIGCDVYEITAVDPYSDDYEETVARNVREQDADARPEIANPLESIDGYDTVIIGSPIWNVRPPMIMSTFAESFDFAGKTVFPLVTYAVSGMGNAGRVYQEACRGATFGDGLAVQGEVVIDAPEDVAVQVETWLQGIDLLREAGSARTPS